MSVCCWCQGPRGDFEARENRGHNNPILDRQVLASLDMCSLK